MIMVNTLNNTPLDSQMEAGTATNVKNKLYLTVWRWHFYSGVFVIPFMVVLALTGLGILYAPQIDSIVHRDRLFVSPGGSVKPYVEQLGAVRLAYPEASLKRFRPGTAPHDSSIVTLSTTDGRELDVYVDPYTLRVLGELDINTRVETVMSQIHGSLLIGDVGDRLIEIAAGLGILLLVTGLYLWWPRDRSGVYGVLIPRLKAGRRVFWRDLHAVPGFYVSIALLFFLVSGMAWTGVWGDKYVQAWNTFPDAMWNDVPKSGQNMESLNRSGEKIVPWNLENSALPVSGSMAGRDGIPSGTPVNIDSVIAFARDNGMDHGFWVAIPADPEGVWTVSASSMSRDVVDARKDRTLHIDQYSGKVLADIGWNEYGLGAKAMSAGIALHMGTLGWWNLALNTLFCLVTLLMCVSAVAMWWKRRPAGVFRLVAPPMPANMPLWKGAVAVLVVLGIAFPLAGAALLAVVLLDFLLISRIAPLKRLLT